MRQPSLPLTLMPKVFVRMIAHDARDRSLLSLTLPNVELDMAYKSQELEFHLTPRGWTTNEISSAYTVESWRLSVYQELPWSREQRAWSRVWHSLAW